MINKLKDRISSIEVQLSGERPSDTYGSIATSVKLHSLGGMGALGGMGGGRR